MLLGGGNSGVDNPSEIVASASGKNQVKQKKSESVFYLENHVKEITKSKFFTYTLSLISVGQKL